MGQLKWNVTGNAIIVISTKLSMCLLDCSVSSVVHKMTHPRDEVSLCSEVADSITIPFCFAIDSTLRFMAALSVNRQKDFIFLTVSQMKSASAIATIPHQQPSRFVGSSQCP
jgi:hypothetical protein